MVNNQGDIIQFCLTLIWMRHCSRRYLFTLMPCCSFKKSIPVLKSLTSIPCKCNTPHNSSLLSFTLLLRFHKCEKQFVLLLCTSVTSLMTRKCNTCNPSFLWSLHAYHKLYHLPYIRPCLSSSFLKFFQCTVGLHHRTEPHPLLSLLLYNGTMLVAVLRHYFTYLH